MSQARLIITAVTLEGRTRSEVARDYGVSRYWVQTLVKRFLAEGEAAYEPRSRRPHSSPNAVPAAVEDQILRLRKELSKQGLDAGADTIHTHLTRAAGRTPRSKTSTSRTPVPAVSTIWRVLTRRGFVTPHRSGRSAPGTGSPLLSPTNAGRPTSPTGSSLTAPGSRSSTSKTTTPASTYCPKPRCPSPPAVCSPGSAPRSDATESRPACSSPKGLTTWSVRLPPG
jgi:hypothetical protein